MKTIKLFIHNLIKAILQFAILPIFYILYKKQRIKSNFVIFADSKNDGIPYSMFSMYKMIKNTGRYDIKILCKDYSKLNILEKFYEIFKFMKLYANAKYIFLCDYFLPVSSCNKRKETIVVQLWHSSGLQKKFGYDSEDDLGNMLFCKPTKNFDLVSVSSEKVKEIFEKAWRTKENCVKAFGTVRTDILFDKEYKRKCIELFYDKYPEARNKKIILWAPTFRGNAVDKYLIGLDDILKVKDALADDFYLIIKLHPRLKEKEIYDNCVLNTEELCFVTDILITDYSSIMYDFLLLNKKIIFYIPDYKKYSVERGMYIDYKLEFNFPITYNAEEIINSIKSYKVSSDLLTKYKEKFINMNDGNVSLRLLKYLENNNNN